MHEIGRQLLGQYINEEVARRQAAIYVRAPAPESIRASYRINLLGDFKIIGITGLIFYY